MITTASSQIEKFEENFDKQSGFLTQKIKAEYRSDKKSVLNNFYCFDDCNIMLMGENLSVCGNLNEEQCEELLSFCQFLGVYGLECRQDNLSVPHRDTMHLLTYRGADGTVCPDVVKNENIYQFSQFSVANFPGTAFNMVYSYFARKVNNGIADIYFMTHNDKIVSGAVATHFDDSIYLTFVSTAKNFRNQGLAKKVIEHIISEYSDRQIILMCEDKLMDFYTKLNFEKTGQIYLYKLREEHI